MKIVLTDKFELWLERLERLIKAEEYNEALAMLRKVDPELRPHAVGDDWWPWDD